MADLPHRTVPDTQSTLNFEQIGTDLQAIRPFDITHFGAKTGDGARDNTSAIQRAVDAASDAGGGQVFIPQGIWGISDRITIPLNVDIMGAGSGKAAGLTATAGSVIKALGANAQLMFESLGGLSGNFVLDGAATQNRTNGFVFLDGAVGRTFISMFIINVVDRGLYTENAQNCALYGCEVQGATDGVVLDRGTGGMLFSRMEINQCDGYHAKIQENFGDEGYTTSGPSHNMFLHCILERSQTFSGGSTSMNGVLYSEAGYNNIFEDCVFAVGSGETINSSDAVVQVDPSGTYNSGCSIILNNCSVTDNSTGYACMRTETGAQVLGTGRLSLRSNGSTHWTYNGGTIRLQRIEWSGTCTNHWSASLSSSTWAQLQRPLAIYVDPTDDSFFGGFYQDGDSRGRIEFTKAGAIDFGSGSAAPDARLVRNAANQPGTGSGDSFWVDQFVDMPEITAPSAPSANQGRLFVRDNGSGKTQLCVRFNSGAIQVLATEP